MDEQKKTKPEENLDKSAELADKDLEKVAGGTGSPGAAKLIGTETHREADLFDTGHMSGIPKL